MKNLRDRILAILNKIFSVQVMAVIIATLQLFIAIPQLKWAYESISNNSSDRLEKAVQDFRNHTASFSIISVPDSINDTNLITADGYLKQIFAYSQIIAHFDYSDAGMDNDYYAKIWFERLKRLVIVMGELNKVEKNIMTTIDDPQFKSLLSLYISPLKQNSINNQLNRFAQKAENNLNSNTATTKDVKELIPFTIDMINSIDEQTVLFVRVLNEYIFMRLNGVSIPVFEKGERNIQFSM